jgi:hypothetical protein
MTETSLFTHRGGAIYIYFDGLLFIALRSFTVYILPDNIRMNASKKVR